MEDLEVVGGIVEHLRGVEERLRRDASHVQARPAQRLFIRGVAFDVQGLGVFGILGGELRHCTLDTAGVRCQV